MPALRGAIRVDRVPRLREGISAPGVVPECWLSNDNGNFNRNFNGFGRTMPRIGADAADCILVPSGPRAESWIRE